jgi:hypothetical protein
MATITDLNLNFNPFRDITPSLSDIQPKWAGMRDVKSKIERAYQDCIENNSKQIILNWGQYGGGKTFSAYYFIKQYAVSEENITHIYIISPKEGSKATVEFFKSVIDWLTFEKINTQIANIIDAKGQDYLFRFLSPNIGQEFAKAICLIGSTNTEISDMMNRFLYVGLTKTELKKLGLAKDISSDADSIRFLSGIISCFIGNEDMIHGKVILWLDEMEDMIYYSPKHYKAFAYVLRDLFNTVNSGFLSFMNFTLAEGEDTTIELILGGALWSRITKKIRYKQFIIDDALEYCNELLNNAQIDKDIQKPFSESMLRSILGIIPISLLTPREINKHLTSLINFSLAANKSEIDDEILSSWIEDYHQDI